MASVWKKRKWLGDCGAMILLVHVFNHVICAIECYASSKIHALNGVVRALFTDSVITVSSALHAILYNIRTVWNVRFGAYQIRFMWAHYLEIYEYETSETCPLPYTSVHQSHFPSFFLLRNMDRCSSRFLLLFDGTMMYIFAITNFFWHWLKKQNVK